MVVYMAFDFSAGNVTGMGKGMLIWRCLALIKDIKQTVFELNPPFCTSKIKQLSCIA